MLKLRSLILSLLVMLVMLVMLAISPVYAQDATKEATFTVGLSSSKNLGKFLVGKDGLTLYSFTPDGVNTSVCYDKCATAWPPLTVDSADKLATDPNIPGTFVTFARKDGALQVTYNGMPLYYWFKDAKAGDTTGNRITRTWWVVPPATVYTHEDAKLGNILVGLKGMTLYTYAKDTADTSACVDKCATNWPPLTVKTADAFVPGLYLPGKFNTITRADGTLQVTYNGQPLYYYAKDQAIGDATGENVGKVWFTVVPETLTVANKTDLGDFLTSFDGMTLYAFAKDTPGVSTCTGDCAKNWPAYTIGVNDRLAAGALKGKLDTIKVDPDTLLVTYNGAPLYFFAKDKVPGDANGQNVGNVWAVVKP